MNYIEMQLSDEQQKIVELTEGQHLVLAPPGTGKTELLAQRVSYALQRGISPEQIICLTFTNRAAKSMKERIEKKYPNSGVFIGNIHNFSLNFLFRNKLIPRFTSLLDEEDATLLFKEAMKSEKITYNNHITEFIRLNTFLKQKKLHFSNDVLLYPSKSLLNAVIAIKVCERYEALKEELSLIDFDDLLILTYYNLVNNKVKNLEKYSWLQVDEVQDLNPLQWEIIRLLSSPNAHKVFFGDYEQAIFSFMGARLERLHAIEKECKVHNLQKNFRSPSYLLKIFIDYAKTHLKPSWKKDPIPAKIFPPPNDALLLVKIKGMNIDEAKYIVDKILPPLISEKGKQTAILVRWNLTAELYSNYLNSKKIEHFKISGYDLFRRQIVKDILAFLGCLENEYDRLSWYRIFYMFRVIPTLEESRHFVNSLFESGFLPRDFLRIQSGVVRVLKDFLDAFENNRIVVFDIETTGLDTDNDDIIQIAAIEIVKGKIGKEFEVYLRTDKNTSETEHIHNITYSYLSMYGENARVGLLKFQDFINGSALVSHNLMFDWKILCSNFQRNNIKVPENTATLLFDSLEITRRLFPKLYSYNLSDLIETFQIKGSNTHNALDDAKATVNLIFFCSSEIKRKLELQNEFYEQNKTKLEKFNKNLFSFWQKYYENYEMFTSFPEIIQSYISHLQDTVNYSFTNDDKLQLSKLLRHMEIKCGNNKLGILLKKYLPEYKLYKEADLILGDEEIVISTIHKAKGLEFENVIVPECVEGVYPLWKSQTKEEINEDARILYVALSRAMKRLVITTHSIYVNKYQKTFQRHQSPFLNCIEKYFNEMSS